MRCERCGVQIGAGRLCETCAESVPPNDPARSAANAGWVCVILALLIIFIGAPMLACPGTLPALRVAAVVIVVGVACAIGGAILAARRSSPGLLLNASACVFVLLGCSLADLAFYKSFYGIHDSHQSKSLNNIKQLALALQTYSQDYNETFPGWIRNTDGTYVHNVWDEQINPQVKSKDVFNNGDTGIRSWSQPAGTTHDRALTYGLNGLLITPPKHRFDGDADFTAVGKARPPQPLSPSELADPANTILFAELSTTKPMPGIYGQRPALWTGANASEKGSAQWEGAHEGWIDISPRAFIEIEKGSNANPYVEPYGANADCGIARDLYGGGGCYAFADGHVKFMKVGHSVGIGTTVKGRAVTPDNCWEPWNTNNMWNPRKTTPTVPHASAVSRRRLNDGGP